MRYRVWTEDKEGTNLRVTEGSRESYFKVGRHLTGRKGGKNGDVGGTRDPRSVANV